jgi:predicted AAA+ superfamily ATPase
MEQILRKTASSEAYFWATQSGAELDLLLFENGKRVGYEFKYSEKPKISRSMRVAMDDLRLDALRIVCPSDVSVELEDGVEVVGLQTLLG